MSAVERRPSNCQIVKSDNERAAEKKTDMTIAWLEQTNEFPSPTIEIKSKTRMWANTQPDGRPAEHRWRPLFNAAKFGWRPLLDAVQ